MSSVYTYKKAASPKVLGKATLRKGPIFRRSRGGRVQDPKGREMDVIPVTVG